MRARQMDLFGLEASESESDPVRLLVDDARAQVGLLVAESGISAYRLGRSAGNATLVREVMAASSPGLRSLARLAVAAGRGMEVRFTSGLDESAPADPAVGLLLESASLLRDSRASMPPPQRRSVKRFLARVDALVSSRKNGGGA